MKTDVSPVPPNAADADPVLLGWMRGAPPPAEKLVHFADMGHFQFPKTRWAFANMRQLVPSTQIWRGGGPVCALPRDDRDDLDAVRFTPIGGSGTMSWAESLDANYTDAIVVLHRGHIVYERYFGVMQPHRSHMVFSVTKSYVGTLGAMLVHEGALQADARIARTTCPNWRKAPMAMPPCARCWTCASA